MALGNATQDLMARTQRRAETHDDANEWANAAVVLSNVLLNSGDAQQAKTLCRETVAAIDGLGIELDAHTAVELLLSMRLGRALEYQGKSTEANVIFVQNLAEAIERFGRDHQVTVECAMSLGDNFRVLGKHAESAKLLRDIMERVKRITDQVTLLRCNAATHWQGPLSGCGMLRSRAKTLTSSP